MLVPSPHPTLLEHRSGEVSAGLLPAHADVEWAPRPGDALDAAGVFRAQAVQDQVMISGHALPWSGGPLRLVLDGPVLEVFADDGVLAVSVAATGRDGVLEGDLDRVTVTRLL